MSSASAGSISTIFTASLRSPTDARTSPRGETTWLRPVNVSDIGPLFSVPMRLAVTQKTRFSMARVFMASWHHGRTRLAGWQTTCAPPRASTRVTSGKNQSKHTIIPIFASSSLTTGKVFDPARKKSFSRSNRWAFW